jgi:hypothetical protein
VRPRLGQAVSEPQLDRLTGDRDRLPSQERDGQTDEEALMLADDVTRADIEALVGETYRRMSTPGADPGELFAHPDMTVAGSGQGELMYGPEEVGDVSRAIAGWGFTWTPQEIRVWREGSVAWAQILGQVVTRRDGVEASVPYMTTGVFVHDGTSWTWRYWGGSEPQQDPRV